METLGTNSAAPRVCLLVDGENISHNFADTLKSVADSKGDTVIRRVYGDMGTPALRTGWGEKGGFRPVHSGQGKNYADMMICVEAMDIMLSGKADVLVLASSDGGFAHLVLHLRERGFRVIGAGEAKTPRNFRYACKEFIEMAAPTAATASQPNSPDDVVRRLVAESGPRTGITLTALNASFRRDTGKSLADLGVSSWRNYFQSRTGIFECDTPGPDAKVRLRQG